MTGKCNQKTRFNVNVCRLSVLLYLFFSLSAQAYAQVAPIIRPGFQAVTSFSGHHIPNAELGIPPNIDPLDEAMINVNHPTLRIFDITTLGSSARGQLVYTQAPFEVTAAQIGQVFGLAYDDGKGVSGNSSSAPNLYVTATVLHGLQIVETDTDGDGRAERLKNGKLGARFMDGQFGPNNAGPGSIWKIDGSTGTVTLFAQIAGNSGSALGNITFDTDNRQFFVSDLDTGLINRISIGGQLMDSFDHGLKAMPSQGFAPFPDDGLVMDINNPTFSVEDPNTWGFSQAERLVWGVGFWSGRLYYSVGSKAQVWSVGLNSDGGFSADARLEFEVTADRNLPITDIAFDEKGAIYLAQRGPIVNRYDYAVLAQTGEAEVLRYVQTPGTAGGWSKSGERFAVGFPNINKQAAGGVDLTFGYDSQGNIDISQCAVTLVKSGDDLKRDQTFGKFPKVDDPETVHGTQLTSIKLARPNNEPPVESWYVDNDGLFVDPQLKGHLGDVEIWRPCEELKKELASNAANSAPAAPVDPNGPFNPASPFNPNTANSPFNPANPASPFNQANLTNPRNPFNPNNPSSPFNPFNPLNPNNPFNSGNLTNPNNPFNPLNPNSPFNLTNLLNPNNPFNPSNPNSPFNLANLGNPTNPFNPNNINSPLNPNNLGNPFNPFSPNNPKSPFHPANLNNPLNPFSAANPNSPFNPANLNNPINPFNPANPNSPLNPVNLANPANPFNPLNPNSPLNPANLSNPFNPFNPNSVANPLSPFNPTSPASPYNSANVGNPTNPLSANNIYNPSSPFQPVNLNNPNNIFNGAHPNNPFNANTLNNPNNPFNANNPNNPLDPANLSNPNNPFNANNPNNPISAGNLSNPNNPFNANNPNSPLHPNNLSNPNNPFNPNNPTSPLNVTNLSDPANPFNVNNPTSPLNPANLNNPGNPFNPNNPNSLMRRGNLLDPANPLNPSNPNSPFAKLSDPANPLSDSNPNSPFHASNLSDPLNPFHPSNPNSPL